MPGKYTYKDGVLKVDCLNCIYGSSVEDFPECMSEIINYLIAVKDAKSIVLSKEREYEYNFEQTQMLLEIAKLYEKITRDLKLFSRKNLVIEKCDRCVSKRMDFLQNTILGKLKTDPVGAYVLLVRRIRHTKVLGERTKGICKECYEHYLNNSLIPLKELLEETTLIKKSLGFLPGYKVGDRSVYRQFFIPSVRPNFTYTKYQATPPEKAELIDNYQIQDAKVEIYKIPNEIRTLYHIIPLEFGLEEKEYELLDKAKRYMARHRPLEREEFASKEVRKSFYNIGLDMLRDLSGSSNIPEEKLKIISNILVRYTAGIGILELILSDDNVQDVYVNSPPSSAPTYLYHGKYGECQTNITQTKEDAELLATRLRLSSGRPLDEANPVLDTEISVPGGRARVCAIMQTLSPEGLGFALRRHREKPWTFPLFISQKMLNPLAGGLLWFIIDGGRSILVGGTRSSGKTSLLGALISQIMKNKRIISVEDSVTGDSIILIKRNRKIEKTKIGNLIDKLIKNYKPRMENERNIVRATDIKDEIEICSINKEGKIEFKKVSSFIRHKTNKDIYEILTSTGRKIKVTGDHSLFSIGNKRILEEIRVRDLEEGNFIVVPRIFRVNNRRKDSVNLLEHLEKLKNFYLKGKEIQGLIKEQGTEIKKVSRKLGYSEKLCFYWKRKGVLPVKVFVKLNKKSFDFKNIKIKPRSGGQPIPTKISLNEDFLTFIGLWIADGCYDKRSILISVVEEESRRVVKSVAKKLDLRVKMHSDTFTSIISSDILKIVMQDVLNLKGNAYTKEVPEWIYNLSKEQISFVLRGIFSGDGCVSEKEIVIPLTSEKLSYDLQTLLLDYDIILRKSNNRRKDGTFNAGISSLKSQKNFREKIGIFIEKKRKKLKKLCSKISTNDSADIIPLSIELKKEMARVCKDFNKNDYIKRGNKIGREHLKKLIPKIPDKNKLYTFLKQLAYSDIFWDRVVSVKKVKSEIYVYDFSVPENENFVCENILAHNTLELPLKKFREIGYNITRLKSRSVITMVETELPAEEVLRVSLRLGDSCLIIGEVRSKEALALYEAMRIGAMANVVAGTIHGESAYGLFDRVVNDLGVPPTSFKATDLILINNTLKSADGLHSFRRTIEFTEIRKHWKKDPAEEKGFVNLLEYNAKKDELEPTPTLLAGESEIINSIAKNVKEWRGDWDAVWSNIKLRADILDTIVKIAVETKKPSIMEASNVILSNSMFHTFSEEVRKESGALDSKEIYNRWLDWFKGYIKGVE